MQVFGGMLKTTPLVQSKVLMDYDYVLLFIIDEASHTMVNRYCEALSVLKRTDARLKISSKAISPSLAIKQ